LRYRTGPLRAYLRARVRAIIEALAEPVPSLSTELSCE